MTGSPASSFRAATAPVIAAPVLPHAPHLYPKKWHTASITAATGDVTGGFYIHTSASPTSATSGHGTMVDLCILAAPANTAAWAGDTAVTVFADTANDGTYATTLFTAPLLPTGYNASAREMGGQTYAVHLRFSNAIKVQIKSDSTVDDGKNLVVGVSWIDEGQTVTAV